nr:DNA polymerase III subunit delta [Bacteroidota bacterium]
MNFEDILNDLKRRIFHPVYFLYGEEPFYIDKISKSIEKTVLSETEKEFNQLIIYGRDTDSSQVIALAREYPSWGSHRVVIVREAQDLKNIEKDEKLKAYLRKPVPTTILVFDYKYKKIDRRTEFSKLAQKAGVLFHSEKLRDYQIPDWIESQIKGRNFTIDPRAKFILTEALGNDLSKIENELNKLVINLNENTHVTPEIIEQNIGISKDYNIFELQNALGKKDEVKVFKIIHYFASNPRDNPAIMVIAMLFSYFKKIFLFHFISDKSENNLAAQLSINKFFVKDFREAAKNYSSHKARKVFSILREYDLKAKGVESAPIADGEILKEMVWRIIR